MPETTRNKTSNHTEPTHSHSEQSQPEQASRLLSRRFILKSLLVATLTGAGIDALDRATRPENARARWLHYRQAGESTVDFAASLLDNPEKQRLTTTEKKALFMQYQSRLHPTSLELWLDGGIAHGLETGMLVYFELSLQDALPQLLDLAEELKIDLGYALPLIAYWSEVKIDSPKKMAQEDIVASIQASAYAALEPLEQVGAPVGFSIRKGIATVLDKTLLKVLPRRGDGRFNVERGSLSNRSVGFYDKEVLHYTHATTAVLEAGIMTETAIDAWFWPGFTQQAQELNFTQQLMYTERAATQNSSGKAHAEFARQAQQLEYMFSRHRKELTISMGATLLELKQQELLLVQLLRDRGLDPDDLTPGQALFAFFSSMGGMDYLFQDKAISTITDPPLDEKLYTLVYDTMNDVRLDIPTTIAEIEQGMELLGYTWQTITRQQAIEVLNLRRDKRVANIHDYGFWEPYIDYSIAITEYMNTTD